MVDDCLGVCEFWIMSFATKQPLQSIGQKRQMSCANSERLIDVGITHFAQHVGKREGRKRPTRMSGLMGNRPLDAQVTHDLVSQFILLSFLGTERCSQRWSNPHCFHFWICAKDALCGHGDNGRILSKKGLGVGARRKHRRKVKDKVRVQGENSIG